MQFLSHLRHLPLLHPAPGQFRGWPKPSELGRTRQGGAEFLPFKKILTQEGHTKRSFLAQGNEGRFWSQTAWVQVPTLPLAFWAMLGKLLYFVSLIFLSCEMGMRQDAETSPQKAMSSPPPSLSPYRMFWNSCEEQASTWAKPLESSLLGSK